MKRADRTSRFRRYALHSVRVLLFVGVILLIRVQHAKPSGLPSTTSLASVDLAKVHRCLPAAASISSESRRNGEHDVLDADGNSIGYVVQTSPAGDHLVGFSGPTNTLIAFSNDDRIVGIDVLSSGDTRDHLKQVTEAPSFLQAFNGLSWQQAAAGEPVDGVSGATLTSLTIQESIICRLGGGRASLRFPDPVTVADARRIFSDATDVSQDNRHSSLWHVTRDGDEIGTLLRTSPSADNTVGYQGPTETIIGFGVDRRVIGIAVRKSFDNDPYVTYVRDDDRFLAKFNHLVLSELAELDPVAAEVEGVSGATMTSMAVTDGMILAAQAYNDSIQSSKTQSQSTSFRWAARDAGTGLVILAGLCIAFTSLRGHATVRTAFQWLLIVYLGLINGDMISQAMIVGWAQNGVPWSRAGGLALLTLAAFAIPITTRRNVYCSHLCPHGAAQHLLKNRIGWRLRLPKSAQRALRLVPALLLGWCVVVAMSSLAFSLVDIEPFDAWVFRVAGAATITIAIVGLVASLFIPMAYCRYGCPTGALLNFLRFNARSDRWSRRDWFAVALVALAFGLWAAS